MKNEIKYVHTNIIAKDWKALAQFYIEVFECVPVNPERDLSGEWVDKLTKIDNANIKGIHLKLPGYDNGPTLEIFGYEENFKATVAPLINEQGFSHIAFHVSSVEDILNRLIAKGGTQYGELIETEIKGIGILAAVYARDPEGNIIEIQNWRKE
jgi:predicted enzyme related to lactoylglutathione lyase